jgi:hypothetical protein
MVDNPVLYLYLSSPVLRAAFRFLVGNEHKYRDLLARKASDCIESYIVNLYGEEVHQEIRRLKLRKKKSSHSAHYQPES